MLLGTVSNGLDARFIGSDLVLIPHQSQVFLHRGPYDKCTYSLGRNYHRKHLDILLTPEKKHSKYIQSLFPGDFLTFSRGRISAPFPIKNSHLFFPIQYLFFRIKKSKKKKNFFLLFLETTTTYEKQ